MLETPPPPAPLGIGRARLAACAGGLGAGLACGFLLAAVVIGFAGRDNPTLSVERSRSQPVARTLEGLLVGLSAVLSQMLVARLEARLEAHDASAAARARLSGFAALGLVPGLALGAVGTLVLHGG